MGNYTDKTKKVVEDIKNGENNGRDNSNVPSAVDILLKGQEYREEKSLMPEGTNLFNTDRLFETPSARTVRERREREEQAKLTGEALLSLPKIEENLERAQESSTNIALWSNGVPIDKVYDVPQEVRDNIARSNRAKDEQRVLEDMGIEINVPVTYDDVLNSQLTTSLKKRLRNSGVSVTDFDTLLKANANTMNMVDYDTAVRNTNIAMTNVTMDDIEADLEDMLTKKYGKDDIIDIDAELESRKEVDAQGHAFYRFNGHAVYGEDIARGILDNEAVREHNHNIYLKDDEYFENWARTTFGLSKEEYITQQYNALDEQLKPIEEQVNKILEAYEAELTSERGKSGWERFGEAMANREVRENRRYSKEYALAQKVFQLRNDLEAFREASFGRGVVAGALPALQTLGSDLASITADAEMLTALNKSFNGDALLPSEQILLDIYKLNNSLNEQKSLYRQGVNGADIGNTLTQAFGYMGNIGMQTAALGGGILKGVTENSFEIAFKEGLKKSTKEAVKQGMKASLKRAAWGVPESLLRAPLMYTTYKTFTDRRLGNYSMTYGELMREDINPLHDMFGAYMSTVVEQSTEFLGDFIDDGVGALGRSLAQTRWMNKVFGKTLSKLDDYTVPFAFKEGLRNMQIQGMIGETASEYASDLFTPILTGDYFFAIQKDGLMAANDKYYGDIMTSDYALTTLAVCGGMAGFGYMTRFAGGAKNAVAINSLRKENKELLDLIGENNPQLRDKVFEAVHTGNYGIISKLDWANTSADDATLAMKILYNAGTIEEMRNDMAETERLNLFTPYVGSVIDGLYRGKMPKPTDASSTSADLDNIIQRTDSETKIVQIAYVDEFGKHQVGNIIFGDYEDHNAIVQVRGVDGRLRNVSLAGMSYNIVETNMTDRLQTLYSLMFNQAIAKETLLEAVQSIEESQSLSNELVAKILESNNFDNHTVGEVVTLTDGRQAVVEGVDDGGIYNVSVTNEKGKKEMLEVSFANILNKDEAMAKAQIEAQAEGEIGNPVVLPTTDNGRVELDKINDSDVLARQAVAQFGDKAEAVKAIDAEITRLETEQATPNKEAKGLDAVAEAKQKGESAKRRVDVLKEARAALVGNTDTATQKEALSEEEKEQALKQSQAKKDAMSTFEFSRDYRKRNFDSRTAENVLHIFVRNASNRMAEIDSEMDAINKGIADGKRRMDAKYAKATSESEIAGINKRNANTLSAINNAEQRKAELEAERKLLAHRKAQYEQTLKDMGDTSADTRYQAGEVGASKEVSNVVNKAAKALGMRVRIGEESEFRSAEFQGKHTMVDGGNNEIVLNPASNETDHTIGMIAHEISHEFKTFLKPAEWAQFENAIMTAVYGENWQDSEAYKAELLNIRMLHENANIDITDDKVREEAVAYAIEHKLFNGEKGAEKFEQVLDRNLPLKDKILNWLKSIIEKIKNFLQGVKASTADGKIEETTPLEAKLQKGVDAFENILKRYAEGKKFNKVDKDVLDVVKDAKAETEVSASIVLADVLESKSETYHQKNETNVSAKTLVKANDDIKVMVDIMKPYLDKTMYGKRVLPEEIYGKGMSTIFKNQSYGASMENTTICLRTLAYLEFVDDVKEQLGRPLTTEESFLASQMLYDIAVDPQCLYCYVSLDRKAYDASLLSYLEQRDGVLAMYDAIEGKKTKEKVEEVYQTFLGGRKDTKPMRDRFNMWINIRKKGESMITAEDLRNRKSIASAEQSGDKSIEKQMKDAQKYAQSASWAKKVEEYRVYTGELLKMSEGLYNKLNNAYGLRFYSFSEYSPAFIVENMQMMRDAALKGLRGLAYTKEVEFAKIFAPTQANINISIFGRRDANGNMVMDTRQGADWNEAQALREQYPNVGLVFVATNDADVEWALAQDFIDVVIPFHIVRTGSNIADFYEWTNYKDMQEDKGGKSILPNEHNNDKETFLRLAEERGLTPRFSKWVDNPNYMKLVNETRRASKDTPYLQPIFNLEEAKASFKAFVDKGGYFGGWYNVDEQGYQDGVEQVYQDIVAGKTAKDVDYGRQDVPADALNTKRKVRQHNNVVLRSSNSLQKQPNTQEVVSDADVVESYSISRNNEATIDKWLGKREDFTDDIKNAFKEYIADFKPATQLATTKWFANGVIRIPEDMPKVEQAMEIAQRKKVDALQYNSPMELIDQFGDVFKPKAKLINPDDVPTLSNKTQVPNTDITIYDVEDSEESRKNFRELMNSHFGKNANPWCLMQANDGILTEDSKDYWNQYNKYPKRAAFKGGKLIAFFASADEPTWWSRMDKPYSGIPITRKIEGDALGRSATYIVSEDGGFDTDNFTEIHRGNKQNGLYEEWYNNDTKKSQVTYKDGKKEGVEERYFRNGGGVSSRSEYKGGKLEGACEYYRPTGELLSRSNYINGLQDGIFEGWYENGALKIRGEYKEGQLDGAVETFNDDGSLVMREVYDKGNLLLQESYTDGQLDGWVIRWDKEGDVISRKYYVMGKRNKLQEFGRKFTESFSIDRSQSAEEIASLAESEGTTSFSLVRDEAKIAELEASPKRIGYRNVILNEDGSFSSPMATHIGNTGKGKVKSATFNLGEWEEAEENPQLVDEKRQVYIYKDNGGSVKVAYDPYIHNRLDKVNAQFKEAWKRPNLVYVETEVPITDLESGYHADKAKLPVGVHSWSNGDLMLSRYDKPIRIVPWEEVADDWVARFKDRGVEFDIVPPALLPILKERGVEILPPHKGLGADATEAYEASRTEQSFSLVKPTNEEVTFDNFYTNSSAVFEKISETPTRKPDFVSKSGSKYWYGEDEGGKYVIRKSNHWSAIVRDAEDIEAFNAKPDNYRNIASCYWALNKENYIKQIRASRGIAYANAKEEFGYTPNLGTQTVATAKAYLTDFTKWEVEPINNIGATKGSTYGLEQPTLDNESPSTANAIAKLNINFETAIEEAIKKTEIKGRLGEHEFLYEIDKALSDNPTIERKGSDYIDIGEGYTLRLADHYANAQNFYKRNDLHDNYGVAIVPPKENTQDKKKGKSRGTFRSHKDVDYKEFVYFPDKMDAEKQIAIFKGLVDFIKTKDFSNLPEPDNTHISTDLSRSYSFSLERADIESKAKADGTWLKAPNGKDTNLSPKQWVSVRTKSFKEWFGDWEKVANIRSGIDALIQIAQGAESIPNAMRRDELTEFGGTAEITFDWGEYGKPDKSGTLRGGFGFAKIIQKHGYNEAFRIIETIANGEIGTPYGVENGKRVDIVNGEYHTTISLYRDGKSESWVLTGYKIDPNTDAKGRGNDLSKATQIYPTPTREDLGAALKSNANIQYFNEIQNISSKIVDENGEPKVVYHQTNATTFVNEEGKEFGELGWRERREWKDREDFEDYWEETDFYKFSRMNARTTMDFDGFFFAPEFDEDYGYGERTIEAFLNIRKPASYGDYTFDYSQNDAGQKERIRLQEEGYDGVINAYDGVIDEYIAFEPNQIKSATENIGTFDSANDDIRYSINRDGIATPEMVAEANEALTESQKAAKVIAEEIEERIKKIAQSKELTFEQIEQLMLDENDDTAGIRRLVYIYNQAQGAKPKKTQAEADAAVEELGKKYNLTIDEAKALLKKRGTAYTAMRMSTIGQYNSIIRNIVDVLRNAPKEDRTGKAISARLRKEMNIIYEAMANANLKAIQQDLKAIINRQYEGKNDRNEKVGKIVDYDTAATLNLVKNAVKDIYKSKAVDGKITYDLDRVSSLWEKDVNSIAEAKREAREVASAYLDKCLEAMTEGKSLEERDVLWKQYLQANQPVVLLEKFDKVLAVAKDIKTGEDYIDEINKEIENLRATWKGEELGKLRDLVRSIDAQDENALESLAKMAAMGYAHITEAKARLKRHYDAMKAKNSELIAEKAKQTSEKLALVEQLKEFNTAMTALEMKGRVAFKAEEEAKEVDYYALCDASKMIYQEDSVVDIKTAQNWLQREHGAVFKARKAETIKEEAAKVYNTIFINWK